MNDHSCCMALVGNPNAGKTSTFNLLTGMNQKVGNFPGVTMDKVSGTFEKGHAKVRVIDLPGTYSIYPRSLDERVVFDALSDRQADDFPDVIVVVADASNLERSLLLFSEVQDLGLPTVLALTMLDIAKKNGVSIDINALAQELHTPVYAINARTGEGLDTLKKIIPTHREQAPTPFYAVRPLCPELIDAMQERFSLSNDYEAYQYAQQANGQAWLSPEDQQFIVDQKEHFHFSARKLQTQETVERYQIIREKLQRVISQTKEAPKVSLGDKVDRILTHKVYGYVIFFLALAVAFQSIFAWAEPLMNAIDLGFAQLSHWARHYLPDGELTRLLAEGIIPGIGGVVIFIPQIAFLFCFIALLEESGYMARAVFLMDRIMRQFGLNGKSIVPLMSGIACAIPAIMATRSIENYKDRMVTIFVTPFISCSARLPVYTILIALVVPSTHLWGFVNLQGLTLMGLYLVGFLGAILSALLVKQVLKVKERSYFIMEMPIYRWPKWKNVGLTIFSKSQIFILHAGKVILAIGVILWVLASYGPGSYKANAEQEVSAAYPQLDATSDEFQHKVQAYRLENSYAGRLGKWIEPVIRPLGYDWKIGIALIASFAAREVFVGTLATIYSVGSEADDLSTIQEKLSQATDPSTGRPMYSLALGVSLMLFYAFSMQCMSTLAVVYRETKSIKWPLIQLAYMTSLAYLLALIAYQCLK